MSEHVILESHDLNVHFKMDEGLLTAVNGVDFMIYEGRTLGIVGESGCGKSVTAQAILRLHPKFANITGTLLYYPKDGSDPVDIVQMQNNSAEIRAIRGGDIAMIFQEPMKAFSPIHTIGDQIIETIKLHVEPDYEKARNIAINMLKSVGISNAEQRINEYPHQLSGGMRQRAMIAMSIACKPRILIADEPTTALDVTVQAQVLDLINGLKHDFGSAVIFITHNLGVIAEMCDEVAVMYLGKIVEYTDVVSLFQNPMHPYTIALMRSIPDMATKAGQKLESIEGTVPYPMNLPKGCGFYSRCKMREKGLCDVNTVEMVEIEQKHFVRCKKVSAKEVKKQ
jgi:peptide/nickel transport system ATP-binding protein